MTVSTWRKGSTLWQFLERELGNPTSPLIVTGERTLAAEFPSDAQARRVLAVIGSGDTTFTAIGSAAGIPQKSLTVEVDLIGAPERPVIRSPAGQETRKRKDPGIITAAQTRGRERSYPGTVPKV